MKLRSFFAVLVFLAFAISPAQARKQHQVYQAAEGCNVLWPCEGVNTSSRGVAIVKAMHGFGVARKVYRVNGAVIGGRPSGCPYQFCGCGASLYLFGKIIPRLNLAANWFSFPRSTPAPRMVAVRSHHVMVLVSHVSGDTWMVHDSNSGGHQTRLHERSIRGYSIVNPSA